ncbi:MAG: methionyl-tRNA formyltransferase, partial [bacterium]|nr:methionyl-tRNA formyltransferase [bacterium]
MIRALFMGTPAAAVPSLAALTGVAEVAAVITQPDASRGRSKHKVAPPVKEAAEEWGVPVFQPNDAASLARTVASIGFDVGIVVAYGRLLSPEVLAMSQFGYLNVHFSLLPRWRGAAPVERAIIDGDAVTGVSLMLLEAGLDTGPVIAAREANIEGDDTGGILTARLAHIGADIIIDSLDDYVSGRRVPAPQISGLATTAPRLTTREAQIHGTLPVEVAERM